MSYLIYLAQSTLCSGLFYGVYFFLLRTDTHFAVKRVYLLSTLILSFIIPLIKINTSAVPDTEILNVMLGALTINPLSESFTRAESGAVTVSYLIQAVLILYALISSFLLYRFVKGIFYIYSLIKTTETKTIKGIKVDLTENHLPPFSFFGKIFIPVNVIHSEDIGYILSHETAHVKHFHTYDILMAETAACAAWLNPFVYLYKCALKENAEFSADISASAASEDLVKYRKVLIESSKSLKPILASSFNSFIKRRLIMLTQKKSKRLSLVKYLCSIPAAAFLILIFSYNSSGFAAEYAKDVSKKAETGKQDYDDSDDFIAVEKMPEYQGDLQAFLIEKIEYPEKAREKNFEGEVFVRFRVNSEGKVDKWKIQQSNMLNTDNTEELSEDERKNLLKLLEEESLRVTALLGDFEAAVQKGKPVTVWMTLPFIYKLKDEGD